jgi:two-component system sensor histidine kinase CpxA
VVKSLFWKLFILFWLTQIATLSITSIRIHNVSARTRPWWLGPTRKAMPLYAEEAVEELEKGGTARLKGQLQRLSEQDNFQYWLMSASDKHELSGIAMPHDIQNAIRSGAVVANNQVYRVGELRVIASPMHGSGGDYVFVAAFAPPPFSVHPVHQLLLPLLAAFFVSGISCLFLARYVTLPLSKLRNTTHALAEGDLSARSGAELGKRSDEIANLVHDFDLMADRLRDLVHSHKRLLGDVSHELRSPLSRLRVALALARKKESQEEAELHDRMEQELARLDGLIEQVLTVARLESKEVQVNLNELSLNELLEEVVYDATFEGEPSGLKINYSAPSAEIRVVGNYELLHRAIENVLRNALRYSEGKNAIEVGLSSEQEWAVVSVRDFGPGIPEHSMPHLFKPFYRVDDSRVESTGGTGLGLAITERAVALHKGEVIAENVSPRGLKMTIRIPIVTSPMDA